MDKDLTKAVSDITGLFARLAGPLAGEVGQMLGDKAFEYRIRNATRIFQRVQVMLANAQIEPGPIASRLFLPALQAASTEDNETLQEKWAALLTNASDGNQISPIFPSFVEILKELTPHEAKLLDLLIGNHYSVVSDDRGLYVGTFQEIITTLQYYRDNDAAAIVDDVQ
jgi:hypothetical protein